MPLKSGQAVKFPDPFGKHKYRFGVVLSVQGNTITVEVHATHVPSEASEPGGPYNFRPCAHKSVRAIDARTGMEIWVKKVGTAQFQLSDVKSV